MNQSIISAIVTKPLQNVQTGKFGMRSVTNFLANGQEIKIWQKENHPDYLAAYEGANVKLLKKFKNDKWIYELLEIEDNGSKPTAAVPNLPVRKTKEAWILDAKQKVGSAEYVERALKLHKYIFDQTEIIYKDYDLGTAALISITNQLHDHVKEQYFKN